MYKCMGVHICVSRHQALMYQSPPLMSGVWENSCIYICKYSYWSKVLLERAKPNLVEALRISTESAAQKEAIFRGKGWFLTSPSLGLSRPGSSMLCHRRTPLYFLSIWAGLQRPYAPWMFLDFWENCTITRGQMLFFLNCCFPRTVIISNLPWHLPVTFLDDLRCC